MEKDYSYYSNSGSRTIKQYSYEYCKASGCDDFVEKDPIDIYAETQEAAKGTSLHELVERYNRGDIAAIPEVTLPFPTVDLSDMPRDIFEAHSRLKTAEESFNNLPADFKAAFDNSFSVYMNSLKDGSHNERMKNYLSIKNLTTTSTTVVPEDEQKS